jgi:hypothetical protein
MVDVGFAEKFPFSIHARQFLKEDLTPGLVARSVNCVETGEGGVAEYAAARIILSLSGNRKLMHSFASRFADRVKSADKAEFDVIAREFFPSLDLINFTVSVVDYVKFFSLDESQLEGGLVHLGDARSVESTVRRAVIKKIEEIRVQDAPEILRKEALKFQPPLPAGEGKLLGKKCMVEIMKGVGEGKRYYGSMALSIACLKDGLTFEQAAKILEQYAANCVKGVNSFTDKEALNTLKWVYSRPTIRFSCKVLQSQGLVSDCSDCEH